MAEADRAGVDVRLVAEGERAAAEHLRARFQLHVDLQADDRLVAVGGRGLPSLDGGHAATGIPSKPSARSRAKEASRSLFSENAGPASCNPTGRPSDGPLGREMAGMRGSG